MSITDIPVLDLIKTRLRWHAARQRVLAENVANADVPGFVPRDLQPIEPQRRQAPAPVRLAVTQAAHIAGRGLGHGAAAADTVAGWETTPDGNAVVLEEQMIKLSQNQLDHQAATTLYGRSIALLRSAIRSA